MINDIVPSKQPHRQFSTLVAAERNFADIPRIVGEIRRRSIEHSAIARSVEAYKIAQCVRWSSLKLCSGP